MSWLHVSSVPSFLSYILLIIITLFPKLVLTLNHTRNTNDIIHVVIGDIITSDITETYDDMDSDYVVPYSERPETYFVPIVMLLIMLIGITGNGILTFIILRHEDMRTIPNTYVLSLALGDLLVLIINVPFSSIVYVLDSWPFGLLLCKIGESVKDISIGVSVFTLTALAADRFFAIADPLQKLHITGGRGERNPVTIAVLIWVLAIVCAIPATFSYIRFFRVNQNVSFYACYPFPPEFGPTYPKVIVIIRCIIYYAVPLIIITVFYVLAARHLMLSTKNIPSEMESQVTQVRQVKARRRTATMVVAFVIIFAICFFPQHIFMLWFYINPTAPYDYNAYWHYFRIVGFCLAFTNSCVNPIALYCMSGSYRKYFNRYLPCCLKRMRRRCSDLNTHGRGRRSSLSSMRMYLRNSHREERSIALSTIVDDIQENTQIKEQETTLTYSNGTDESLKNQRILIEPTVHDQLIVE